LLYAADMALAGSAWKKNEPGQVRLILDRYAQPRTRADGSQEEDLRGFEWYFLDRQTRPQSELLFQNSQSLYVIEFMPDGKEFFTAGKDSIVRWHDTESGRVLRQLDTQQKEINCASYNPSRTIFATAGEDGTAKVWDAESFTLLQTIKLGDGVCYFAKFLNDDSVIANRISGDLKLFNIATGQHLREYKLATPKLPKGSVGASSTAYISKAGDRFWTSENWGDNLLYPGFYEWNVKTGKSLKISEDVQICNILSDRLVGQRHFGS
jgi:WD40 repeat protein